MKKPFAPTALCCAILANVASAAAVDKTVLEEVIVTATKRAISAQDLGMSISALPSEELELMGAQGFEDFAASVPNLSFGYGGSGDGRNARSFAVRGISGRSTTGFYLDETPLPNFVEPRLVDVARVEVLRGPQGTLYGASSMGGTVRIISNTPNTEELSGLIEATISNTKEGDWNYRLEGVVNIPLVEDKLALRLIGYYEDEAGVFDRIYPDDANPGGTRRAENVDYSEISGFQAALGFTPSENLEIVTKVAYQEIEEGGASWSSKLGNFDQNRLANIPEFLNDEWTYATATVNYDLGWANLVSATSYFDREYIENEDITEIGLAFFGIVFPSEIDQVVEDERLIQEFRLTSDLEGPFQYTVGLFYSNVETSAPSTSIPEGFEAAFAAAIGLPGVPVFGGTDTIFAGIADLEVEEVALFGELSYDLSDALTVTVGARWFDVESDRLVIDTGIAAAGSIPVDASTSESDINPKISLDYTVNDDIMIYTSAAKGYRNGGVSAAIPEFCGPDVASPGKPFDSDSLWSYEIGTKTSWMGNTLQLNGAVFFIQWDDIQQGKQFGCGFGAVVNAGQAESTGFELELTALPAEGLELALGIGYADAEVTEGEVGVVAAKGDRLLQVPELTAKASILYSFPVSFAESAYFHADWSYTGDSLTQFPGDPFYTKASAERESYQLLNARLGMQKGDWEASVFVTNLLDENANLSEVFSLAAEIPGLERYATNRPRTIGIQARLNF